MDFGSQNLNVDVPQHNIISKYTVGILWLSSVVPSVSLLNKQDMETFYKPANNFLRNPDIVVVSVTISVPRWVSVYFNSLVWDGQSLANKIILALYYTCVNLGAYGFPGSLKI